MNISCDIRPITHEALWRYLMTLWAQTFDFLFPIPSPSLNFLFSHSSILALSSLLFTSCFFSPLYAVLVLPLYLLFPILSIVFTSCFLTPLYFSFPLPAFNPDSSFLCTFHLLLPLHFFPPFFYSLLLISSLLPTLLPVPPFFPSI